MPLLLPYLPLFVKRFDRLGAHLPLLRPHLPKLLPYLKTLAPYSERFAPHLSVSANADVLLFYFGWVLKVPWLAKCVLRLPGLPRVSAFLSKRMPRRPVRGRTCDYECMYDDCDVVVYEAQLAARREKQASDETLVYN